MTLHTDMQAAGLVTGTHCYDLYVLDTPQARAILAQHGLTVDGWNVQPFRDNVTGKPSLDCVFKADRS